MGKFAYDFLRAYENRNFDMQTNGEEWILSQVGRQPHTPRCVLDIGSNVGDWLLLCRKHCPESTIHAFEIAPETFKKLENNTRGLNRIHLNPTGLSDKNEQIEIHFSVEELGQTSLYKEHLDPAYRTGWDKPMPSKTLDAKVILGDDYVKEHSLEEIDIMKIDVEGMEERVLRGFGKTFSERRVRLVQFEYNTINIISKFLLRDAYRFFSSHGYRLGKLFPNYVEFRDYHYTHENFCGPNFVAIRDGDMDLHNALFYPEKTR